MTAAKATTAVTASVAAHTRRLKTSSLRSSAAARASATRAALVRTLLFCLSFCTCASNSLLVLAIAVVVCAVATHHTACRATQGTPSLPVTALQATWYRLAHSSHVVCRPALLEQVPQRQSADRGWRVRHGQHAVLDVHPQLWQPDQPAPDGGRRERRRPL